MNRILWHVTTDISVHKFHPQQNYSLGVCTFALTSKWRGAREAATHNVHTSDNRFAHTSLVVGLITRCNGTLSRPASWKLHKHHLHHVHYRSERKLFVPFVKELGKATRQTFRHREEAFLPDLTRPCDDTSS